MPESTNTLRRWLAAAVTVTTLAGTASAQEPTPDVVLRYDGLTARETFKFRMNGAEHAKAVGGLRWQFPASSLATLGFDPAPVTFCIEPLVPITAGQEYGLTIDSFGKPRDFAGLKADKAGVEAADRRAKYVRELFAKHYAEAVKDNGTVSAFQVAVWELVSETQTPAAPAAYSLYSGTFQAVEPVATAPAFVRTAEGYLKGLTGDDAAFATAPLLAGRELVQLSGTNISTGTAAQAQLGVRNRGGVNNLVSPFGTDANSFGGLGGGGFAPQLGGRNPLGGFGGGGFGGGGGGFGGGFFGGVGGGGTTTTSPPTTSTSPPPPGTIEQPGGNNPINPNSPPPPVSPPPGVPPVPPVPPGPPVPPVPPPPGVPPISPPPGVPPISPPPGVPPVPPPPEPPHPDPIPAPPALLLGVIAAGVFGVRKLLKKHTADSGQVKDEPPPAAE